MRRRSAADRRRPGDQHAGRVAQRSCPRWRAAGQNWIANGPGIGKSRVRGVGLANQAAEGIIIGTLGRVEGRSTQTVHLEVDPATDVPR